MSETKNAVIDQLNYEKEKNIFDIFFKVKISSNEEREKVVNHLRAAGFYHPDADMDKSKVIGLVVGNAYMAEMLYPSSLDNSPNPEYTVEEVLNMKFNESESD